MVSVVIEDAMAASRMLGKLGGVSGVKGAALVEMSSARVLCARRWGGADNLVDDALSALSVYTNRAQSEDQVVVLSMARELHVVGRLEGAQDVCCYVLMDREEAELGVLKEVLKGLKIS
jgi:hypothetical protein